MSDLISRSALARAMGVENAVKYGNETAEQQHNSYDTLMKYEIADYIEDAPAVDAVEVVRCRDCREIEPCVAVNDWYAWCNKWGTVVSLDGFCHKGAKVDAKEDENAAD